jgi:hypothetical protein
MINYTNISSSGQAPFLSGRMLRAGSIPGNIGFRSDRHFPFKVAPQYLQGLWFGDAYYSNVWNFRYFWIGFWDLVAFYLTYLTFLMGAQLILMGKFWGLHWLRCLIWSADLDGYLMQAWLYVISSPPFFLRSLTFNFH